MVEGGVTPGWSLFSRRNNRVTRELSVSQRKGKKKKAAHGRTGKLLTMDTEKAEEFNEFSASVFIGNLTSSAS